MQQTYNDIKSGKTPLSSLPPIQVLVGPDDWYFSLNNRRLWVLKRLREDGLLPHGGMVCVRVRSAKSAKELQRYTVDNCVLEAKFMRERPQQKLGDAAYESEAGDDNRGKQDEESDEGGDSDAAADAT